MKITLLLSGSIAAFKACALVSALIKDGHEVQCVASEGALRFVGAASLEGLSGKAVLSDLWEHGKAMAHIELRRWSDLFVFYPASANRINQLAAGISADLIGSIFLANNLEKPFWIAPAMNANMLAHPATQEALAKLDNWGYRIVHGEPGSLACGDIGSGRLAEPEYMLDLIRTEAVAQSRAKKGETRRLLISGGAMDVSVDSVRSIRNTSSGKTASAIAGAFLSEGWAVDYLHHASAELAGSAGARYFGYRQYTDFDAEMNRLLSENRYDAVIHAAAVSDYRVSLGGGETATDKRVPAGVETPREKNPEKLESSTELELRLLPNPKIIDGLRSKAMGTPVIVAFKLTTGENEKAGLEKARRTLDAGRSDLVVWNDLSTIDRPAGTTDRHPFTLFGSGAAVIARGESTPELASELFAEVNRLSRQSGFHTPRAGESARPKNAKAGAT